MPYNNSPFNGPQGDPSNNESTQYFNNNSQYAGNESTQYPGYQGSQPNGYPNNAPYGQGYPPQYPNQGQWKQYPQYNQPPANDSNNMKYVWIGLIVVLLGVIAFLTVKLLSDKDNAPAKPAIEQPTNKPTEPTTKPTEPTNPTEPTTKPVEPVKVETPKQIEEPAPVPLAGNWTFEGYLENGDEIEISLDSDSKGNCNGYFNNTDYGLWIDLSGKLTADSFNVSGYDTSGGNYWKLNCKRTGGYNYEGRIKSSANYKMYLTSNR